MFAKNTKFCALFVSRSCAPDIIYACFGSVAAHNTLCAHYTLSIKHTYMGGTVLFILFYFIWGGVGGVWNGAQISFRFALYLSISYFLIIPISFSFVAPFKPVRYLFCLAKCSSIVRRNDWAVPVVQSSFSFSACL